MARRQRPSDYSNRAELREARRERQQQAEQFKEPAQNTRVLGNTDKPLILIIIALTIVGMLTLFSATASQALDQFNNSLYFVIRQALFFAAGFGLLWWTSRIPYFYWARLAKPFSLIVIGLLLYTMLNGVEAYGAERWIRIFGVQFQPSELGKISVILLLAEALRSPSGQGRFTFILNGFLIALTIGLIYQQPSLSMTLILSTMCCFMLYISGTKPAFLISFLVPAGMFVAYKLMHTEYQRKRIIGWINPWGDPQNTGYNVIQSMFAISNGGLFGSGIGESFQKHYYLPFHHTDFIFAIFAEEWGFTGCVLLLLLFAALVYRGCTIAQNSRSTFAQFLAMGLTITIMMQVIINVCVATGLFPVTGLTLPFVSYGGTSILVTMTMLGILLNISRYTESPDTLAGVAKI